MPKLSCNVTNCGNNNDNYCCISNIDVSGDRATNSVSTCCSSFIEQTGATNCTTIPNPEVAVKCEAHNCKHNCDCECKADSIQIAGHGACDCEDTECSSFCCK